MIESLATIAQFLFLFGTISQVRKCVRDGHADGLSHGLIWQLIVGFFVMIIYTVEALNANPILLLGYVGQLLLFSIIVKYKYRPRQRRIGNHFDRRRYKNNKHILKVLEAYVEKFPSQRFGQVIRNCGMVDTVFFEEMNSRDGGPFYTNIFNEEPDRTLKRMLEDVSEQFERIKS